MATGQPRGLAERLACSPRQSTRKPGLLSPALYPLPRPWPPVGDALQPRQRSSLRAHRGTPRARSTGTASKLPTDRAGPQRGHHGHPSPAQRRPALRRDGHAPPAPRRGRRPGSAHHRAGRRGAVSRRRRPRLRGRRRRQRPHRHPAVDAATGLPRPRRRRRRPRAAPGVPGGRRPVGGRRGARTPSRSCGPRPQPAACSPSPGTGACETTAPVASPRPGPPRDTFVYLAPLSEPTTARPQPAAMFLRPQNPRPLDLSRLPCSRSGRSDLGRRPRSCPSARNGSSSR